MFTPEGVSGIAIQGDVEAGQIHVPRAKALLRRLVERARVGGVQTMSDYVRIDDLTYCYAVVAMGIHRAVIVCDGSTSASATRRRRQAVDIPDFYSGTVTRGFIEPGDPTTNPPTPPRLNSFQPTPECSRLFDIPGGNRPSARLAVEPWKPFENELKNTEEPPVYSQYAQLKPTMYSGLMRKCIQLLMGFGRQEGPSIYDRTPPRPTRRAREESGRPPEPTRYEREVASEGLQIRYDWRWYRTHGIGRGADGTLWLIEIGSTRGAIAMPLPMHAATMTEKFRDKLDDLADRAGLEAVDTFGGFPTGEGFPDTDIDAWVRAGRVLRLASLDQVRPFYERTPFGSPMGWAFNASGNEARNTCWDYEADDWQTAWHYGLTFFIGSVNEVDPAPNASQLLDRFDRMRGHDDYEAVKFKISRMTQSQVNSALGNTGSIESQFDELNQLTIPPMANFSSNFFLVESGRLAGDGDNGYHMKFPWPEIKGLVHHNMRHGNPDGPPRGPAPSYCDTTMHVFFQGDQLKWCRYFYDSRGSSSWNREEDDSDGCELVGVFTHRIESGRFGIPATMYTSEFDRRREHASNVFVQRVVARRIGVTSISFGDDIIKPWLSAYVRGWSFQRDTETTRINDGFSDAACVAPMYERCAYYYAHVDIETSRMVQTGSGYTSRGDPWSCVGWRNVYPYVGRKDWEGNWTYLVPHPDGCGAPTLRTVLSPGAVRGPEGGCSEFSDAGPWCFTCEQYGPDGNDFYFSGHPIFTLPLPPLPPPTTVTSSGGRIETWLVTDGPFPKFKIDEYPVTRLNYEAPWFEPSPKPDTGDVQRAEVGMNTLGAGTAMRYSDRPNGVLKGKGEPEPFGLTNPMFLTFIGVYQ